MLNQVLRSEIYWSLLFTAAIQIATSSFALGDEDFYERVVAGQQPTVHWNLGESPGSTTADNMGSLGAVADGTYGAAVDLGAIGLATSSNNTAIDLEKTVDDVVLLPVLPGGNGDFTEISVSFWVQGEDNGQSNFVGYAESITIDNALTIGQIDGQGFYVGITGEVVFFPNIDVLDGASHHVGISWLGNGRILRVYIDGQHVGTQSPIGQFNCILDSGPLAIGQDIDTFGAPYGFDPAQAFDGVIDEFAFFERILSPSEFALQANPPSSVSQIRFDIDSSTESLDETEDNFVRLTDTTLTGNDINTSFNANAGISGIVSISVAGSAGTIPIFRDRGPGFEQYPNLLRDFVGHSQGSSEGSTIEVTLSGLPNANYIVSTYHFDRFNAPNNPATAFDIFVDDANGINQQERDNAFVGASDPNYIGEAFEVTSNGIDDVVIRIVEDGDNNATYFNGITLQPLTEALDVTGFDQTDTETQTLNCDSALFYRIVYDGASSCFSLDTLDSPNDIDTEIALFDANGTLIDQNDQAGSANQSLLEMDGLDAGTYYLAVSGWNSIFADGFFVQQVQDLFTPGQVVVTAKSGAALPFNDNWNDPFSGIPDPNFTVNGTNVKASTQENEQQLENTGSTVWWFVNAAKDGTFTIDTFGSDFDTQLHIYEFDSSAPVFENLIPIANNNDSGGLQSQVTFEATAGTCYEIRVGGFRNSGQTGAGAEGQIVLNGSFEASPDVLLGDVNLDGAVNLLDVAPFVDLVSEGFFQPEGDTNEDGSVNLLDVAPFIAILSAG